TPTGTDAYVSGERIASEDGARRKIAGSWRRLEPDVDRWAAVRAGSHRALRQDGLGLCFRLSVDGRPSFGGGDPSLLFAGPRDSSDLGRPRAFAVAHRATSHALVPRGARLARRGRERRSVVVRGGDGPPLFVHDRAGQFRGDDERVPHRARA